MAPLLLGAWHLSSSRDDDCASLRERVLSVRHRRHKFETHRRLNGRVCHGGNSLRGHIGLLCGDPSVFDGKVGRVTGGKYVRQPSLAAERIDRQQATRSLLGGGDLIGRERLTCGLLRRLMLIALCCAAQASLAFRRRGVMTSRYVPKPSARARRHRQSVAPVDLE